MNDFIAALSNKTFCNDENLYTEMQLLSTGNMACTTENVNFYFI